MIYAALYYLLVLWAIIYIAYYVFKRQKGLTLPLHDLQPPPFNVVLKPFHLIIDTTIFNQPHDTFAVYLYNTPLFRRVLQHLYNVGNIFGVLGMFGGIAVLAWTTVKLSNIMLYGPNGTFTTQNTLAKRSDAVEPADLPFHLIIPGLTAPIGHLPVLLLALFVGQTTHELGHAICAALESVPLNSAGASIFVALPSAFVALSSGTLQRLQPTGRLRIISAGAFHNLFAWTSLYLLGWIGIGPVILSAGYRDISQYGRLVVSLDDDSPLSASLPMGAVITKLNDFSLRGSEDKDFWSQYFLEPSTIPESNFGWCVQENWFLAQDQICCSVRSQHTTACFSASAHAPETGRCIDPVPVLTDLSDSKRCSAARPCDPEFTCVTPIAEEHLLRITFELHGSQELLLWSGPAIEIWQQVEVGNLLPRTFLSPIWLPQALETFFIYLKIVMLSLYTVNLLPLPFLDGDQLLAVVTELLFRDTHGLGQDLEAGDRGYRSWSTRSGARPNRRKTAFKAAVHTITWTVLVLSSLLTLVHWYRS